MVDLKRAAAIVGIHEHVTRYAPDKSELQIQGESVIKALEDAGAIRQRLRVDDLLQQRPRGLAGVEVLAHCAVGVKLPEAGRLRPGAAERVPRE